MTLNVESELYERKFLVGTGLQELDKHGKAEGYLLRCVDEYVAANGCVNVASWEDASSSPPGDPNAGFRSFGLTKAEVAHLNLEQAKIYAHKVKLEHISCRGEMAHEWRSQMVRTDLVEDAYGITLTYDFDPKKTYKSRTV